MSESRIGYMCAKDFMYHLENDSNEQRIYSSVEDLQEKRPCVKTCGIVKVKISVEEIISESSF